MRAGHAGDRQAGGGPTWDLVHDRPDGDPVKDRVAECHEELAALGRLTWRGH